MAIAGTHTFGGAGGVDVPGLTQALQKAKQDLTSKAQNYINDVNQEQSDLDSTINPTLTTEGGKFDNAKDGGALYRTLQTATQDLLQAQAHLNGASQAMYAVAGDGQLLDQASMALTALATQADQLAKAQADLQACKLALAKAGLPPAITPGQTGQTGQTGGTAQQGGGAAPPGFVSNGTAALIGVGGGALGALAGWFGRGAMKKGRK
jgi:hypothetical protein